MKEMENARKTKMMVMGILLLPAVLTGIISLIILQLMGNGSMTVFGGTIGMILVTACAVCALSVLAKRVSDRIQEFTEDLDQVAEEKLAAKREKFSEREKELGEILRSMNCMTGNIAPVINEVKHASASLREISEEFTHSFQAMAESMEQADSQVESAEHKTVSQTESVKELQEQIAEINRSVDGILDQAKVLEQSLDKMKEYSKSARETIEELVNAKETGNQVITDMRAQTDMASQSAEQVKAVSEMIAGISGQANLAALNASIEAARAGERGRGFASVADEIRTLADQARESSERINTIAEKLSENIAMNAESRQKAIDAYEEQADKISCAEEFFASLNEEMEQVRTAAGSIADQASKLKSSEEMFDTDIVTLPEPVKEKTVPDEQIDHIGSFKITDFRK